MVDGSLGPNCRRTRTRTVSWPGRIPGNHTGLRPSLYAIFQFFIRLFNHPKKDQFLTLDLIRLDLGRTIVLGLEFIVASDVIETTTTPDYYALGILSILVVIRTFLSYFLKS